MVAFLLGCVAGCTLGVLIMACLVAGRDADRAVRHATSAWLR